MLVVWKLDRLSRSLKDLLHILERVETTGARFRSLTEAVDTSGPAGRMLMQMLGSFAEFERAMVRERTRAGLKAAAARGRKGGRQPKLTPEQTGALHGSLRHSVGGRDPQEGDDEDADNSFGRRGFGPRWADVAPAQARCGVAPVAGGGSGDPLAGAGRHRRDPDGMAGHLCGGR